MWKAFDEMERMGWIGPERPKMFSVQAAGCAPMVRAWESGATEAEPWADAATYAAGLRVPEAVGDFLILRAIRESGGAAVAIPDQDMSDWVQAVGADTGIFAAPEGGAVAAAVPALKALTRTLTSGTFQRHNVRQGDSCVPAGAVDEDDEEEPEDVEVLVEPERAEQEEEFDEDRAEGQHAADEDDEHGRDVDERPDARVYENTADDNRRACDQANQGCEIQTAISPD